MAASEGAEILEIQQKYWLVNVNRYKLMAFLKCCTASKIRLTFNNIVKNLTLWVFGGMEKIFFKHFKHRP